MSTCRCERGATKGYSVASPPSSDALLTPAGLGALDAMADLHADARVWRHLPSGRHTALEQTRSYLVEREQQLARDGLGYWIVTLRRAVGELAAGDIAGIGGCAVPPGASWWNLYYRFSPAVHRHGLATELRPAAINAAHPPAVTGR